MKRKRFIPLLLVLTLSTSALSFSPTWGEPANESGNPPSLGFSTIKV